MTTPAARDEVKKGPYFPLGGGVVSDKEATATCYCGEVQLIFPTSGDGLVDTFVCHCSDCRKITASVFASNFIVKDSHLKHAKGQDKLSKFSQSKTVGSGNVMSNYFCSNCGTLMYRVGGGFPGVSIMRIGTIDDFQLQETMIKPRVEQYIKDKCNWVGPIQAEIHDDGSFYKP